MLLSTNKSKLSLLALLSVGAIAISACSKDRGNNQIIPKPKTDAGMDDDGGMTLDSGNNNNQDGGNGDTGNNNQDGGNGDTGNGDTGNNDAGMAECAVNTDCTSPNDSCLAPGQSGLVQCTGQANCQCWQACDPYVNVDQSGCPRPAEACATAGGMSPTPGVCIPDTGGFTQGQACTSMWAGTDPTMDFTGDDCNGAQNFICHGSDPLDVVGTCVRLCDTSNNALCTSLDPSSTCVPFAPTVTQGVCLVPITDLATACQNASECQGGYCAAELGGQCSQQCGVSFTCGQTEGLCVFGQNISPLCARTCSAAVTGDPECAAINPGTICENLGSPQQPLNLCFPRCAMDADCGAPPATCNTGTGHCQ
jgi:hypothetical protein